MAANFQHPFHCVQFLERQSTGLQDLVLASFGPKIHSYAAESGQRLATWPENVDGREPPEKKRKVSNAEEQSDKEGSKNTGEESNKSTVSIVWSSVPLLVVSSNGKYLVALTSEDKCIRVFAVHEDGSLEQLSARYAHIL